MKRKPSRPPHIFHSAYGAPPGKEVSQGAFTTAAGIWVATGHPPFK